MSSTVEGVRWPAQIQLLLTERCNLACRHCAVPEEDSPAEHELDDATWAAFIEGLAQRGVTSVVLSGGEALLRRGTVDLAVSAHEVGVQRTTIVTNGHPLSRETARQLAQAQDRFDGLGLHVSLDGASATTHDWMRGAGAFAQTLQGLDRLDQHGGRLTGVHTVVHPGNLTEIDAVLGLVLERGATTWTVFPVAELGRGEAMTDAGIDPATWRGLVVRLVAARTRYGLDIGLMGPVLDGAWPDTIGELPRPRAPRSPQICAGPDGVVFTCPPLRAEPLGTVDDALNTGHWDAIAERAHATLERSCHHCAFLHLCTGTDLDNPWRARPPGARFGHPGLPPRTRPLPLWRGV